MEEFILRNFQDKGENIVMMRFLYWLFGWVEFSIFGSCGKFLTQSRKYIWNVKKKDSEVKARCRAKSYKNVARSAKNYNCRTKVKRRGGIRFFVHKYRKRKGIAIGILAVFIISLGSNLFVWEVRTNGNIKISDEQLLKAAQESGLHSGTWIPSVDVIKLQYDLQDKFDKLAWVSVNRNGTVYTIEVSEVNPKPQIIDKSAPCNVVSTQDGIILSIEPYDGFPLVKAGDVVKQDELLVSGIKELEDSDQVFYAHARAKVRARVQRQKNCVRPLSTTRAGDKKEDIVCKKLDLFGLKIPLDFNKPEEDLEKKEFKKEDVVLFGIVLPIKIETTKYEKRDQQVVENDESELKRLLIDDAKDWENSELCGATILEREHIFEKNENDLTLHIKCTVEQEIGEERPIIVN